MTTRVIVKTEGNRPMFVGTRSGATVTGRVTESGAETSEFWVHGDMQVIVREANEQDMADRT